MYYGGARCADCRLFLFGYVSELGGLHEYAQRLQLPRAFHRNICLAKKSALAAKTVFMSYSRGALVRHEYRFAARAGFHLDKMKSGWLNRAISSAVIYSNTTSVNMNTPSVNTEQVCALRSLVSPTPVLTQV